MVDSNVVVSAALSSTGNPGRALILAFEKGVVLYSLASVREFANVLSREKFAKYVLPHSVEALVSKFVDKGVEVDIVSTIVDCRDPNDNKFLELALDGEADFIVTGDEDLLVLHPWRGIDILTPTDFLVVHAKLTPPSPSQSLP